MWSHIWAHAHHHRETDTKYPNKDDKGKKGQERGALALLNSADRSKQKNNLRSECPICITALTSAKTTDSISPPWEPLYPLPCSMPLYFLSVCLSLSLFDRSSRTTGNLRSNGIKNRGYAILMLILYYVCSHRHTKNVLCAHIRKRKVSECLCESCHNFRCKSSVEVVQDRVWYSTQLCLTALLQANKHSTGSS